MTRRLLGLPRAAWLALGAAIALVGGYFGFHALFVKVGRSVEQPFSGPARYDHYYVLQRYLEQRGIRVNNVRSWPQPLERDAVVMWFSDAELPDEVRRWLAAGGQLWTFGDPDARSEAEAWNWRPTPWDPAEAQAQQAAAQQGDAAEQAAAEQDVSADEPAAPTESAARDEHATDQAEPGEQDEDEPLASSAAAGDHEQDQPGDEHWCSEEGCLVAAQFHYGAGCLTLVGSYGLQNEQVILGETPERIDALLRCPRRPASVLVVTGGGSPWFGKLLIEHAPQALLACAALLVLALWRAARHLGPKLPPRRRERRQMLEHIGAVGVLAGRVGSGSLLIAARRELRKRVFERAPQTASLSGEALVAAVAQATEVPAAEVRRALLDEPAGDSQAALAVARAVQALWRKT